MFHVRRLVELRRGFQIEENEDDVADIEQQSLLGGSIDTQALAAAVAAATVQALVNAGVVTAKTSTGA